MPHRHSTWLGALALSIIALAPLRAQTGLTPQDSLRLDSLDGLRRELVRANEARPKYGIPMIDRFFRYEPVAPYNQNRGYQFLHAVAASMARNQKPSSSTGGPLQTLIEIGGGKDFDFGKWRIGIDGVIDLLTAKNSIDGQWFGYGVLVARKLGEGRSIRLRSSIYYALKSRNWYHEHNLLLYYAPQLNGLMVLSGGHTSRETFHLTPEEIYRGYYGALPAANSPVASFVKDYLQLRNRIQLTESLDLSTSLLFEDRSQATGRYPLGAPSCPARFRASALGPLLPQS